jgi:hypothetical protein
MTVFFESINTKKGKIQMVLVVVRRLLYLECLFEIELLDASPKCLSISFFILHLDQEFGGAF